MDTKHRQIEAFIFYWSSPGDLRVLLLRRIPERGGFWQPVTGGVERGESLEQACARECKEETGILQEGRIIPTEFWFEFEDHGKSYVEYVFGVELEGEPAVEISPEHDAFRWGTVRETFTLLRWPGNKNGLQSLCRVVGVPDSIEATVSPE